MAPLVGKVPGSSPWAVTPTRSLGPRLQAEFSIIKWTLKVKKLSINWTLEFGLSIDARCE